MQNTVTFNQNTAWLVKKFKSVWQENGSALRNYNMNLAFFVGFNILSFALFGLIFLQRSFSVDLLLQEDLDRSQRALFHLHCTKYFKVQFDQQHNTRVLQILIEKQHDYKCCNRPWKQLKLQSGSWFPQNEKIHMLDYQPGKASNSPGAPKVSGSLQVYGVLRLIKI